MTQYLERISPLQTATAAVETYAYSRKAKDTLYMTGSVALSQVVGPSIANNFGSGISEQYIMEPIIAGLLYGGSKYFMGNKKSIFKNMAKGFIVGASSAVVDDLVSPSLSSVSGINLSQMPMSSYSSNARVTPNPNYTGSQSIVQ